MGAHKRHRKESIAAKVQRDHRISRWLIRLDKIFIQIEMQKKARSK